MARSTLIKAFGLRWGALADTTTWEPLPPSILRLLIAIAEAEKLEAERAARAAGTAATARAPEGAP
jgi:hypothetical protein